MAAPDTAGGALGEEIRHLRSDLAARADAADEVAASAEPRTDHRREFPPEDMTDRELAAFLREELEAVQREIWARPDPRTLTSHRGAIVGGPVLALKRAFMHALRFYSDLIDVPLAAWQRRTAATLRAMAEQARRDHEALKALEERFSRTEEKVVLLLARLEDRDTGHDA